MIRRAHNRRQNQRRIPYAQKNKEKLPPSVLPPLITFEHRSRAENGAVPEEGTAYAEGVSEVHAWHCCEGVDVLSGLPDRLRVVVADAVDEAVFAGEEPGRHAWVDDEGDEGEEVC